MTEPSLGAVRDLLMQVLLSEKWMEGVKHPGLELDIQLDPKEDALIVKGYNLNNDKSLGFAITRASINDGSYKWTFRPSLLKLVTLLTNPSAEVA